MIISLKQYCQSSTVSSTFFIFPYYLLGFRTKLGIFKVDELMKAFQILDHERISFDDMIEEVDNKDELPETPKCLCFKYTIEMAKGKMESMKKKENKTIVMIKTEKAIEDKVDVDETLDKV